MEFEIVQIQDNLTELKDSVRMLTGDDADAAAFFRRCFETKSKADADGRDATIAQIDLGIAGFVTQIMQNDVRQHSGSTATDPKWKTSSL